MAVENLPHLLLQELCTTTGVTIILRLRNLFSSFFHCVSNSPSCTLCPTLLFPSLRYFINLSSYYHVIFFSLGGGYFLQESSKHIFQNRCTTQFITFCWVCGCLKKIKKGVVLYFCDCNSHVLLWSLNTNEFKGRTILFPHTNISFTFDLYSLAA